jgi:hypothetical protein
LDLQLRDRLRGTYLKMKKRVDWLTNPSQRDEETTKEVKTWVSKTRDIYLNDAGIVRFLILLYSMEVIRTIEFACINIKETQRITSDNSRLSRAHERIENEYYRRQIPRRIC